MVDSRNGPASFWTKANALLRKNLIFQRRNARTNIRLILSPLILCLFLAAIQTLVNILLLDKSSNQCRVQNSILDQSPSCPIHYPPEWPPLLQIPSQHFRAVRTDSMSFEDLPDPSCKRNGSCPVTLLITGNNQTIGQSVAGNMFASPFNVNLSDFMYSLADNVLGSEVKIESPNFRDRAFFSGFPLSFVHNKCGANSGFSIPFQLGSVTIPQDVNCVRGLHIWRNSSSEINDELYKGYLKGNPEGTINEILAAYDFWNTNMNLFNVSIWYISTYKNEENNIQPLSLLRMPRSVNLASNAYLQHLFGPGTKMLFEFVKEMPKPETHLTLDIASALGPLFVTWVIIQLFPVVLNSLVYEKQYKLRLMMKMHGLGDGAYWMISYAYFVALSFVYMLCFVIFGSLTGLHLFTLNDYRIKFLFYFIYINLQVSLAFLLAGFFSNVKTASVVGYLLVFTSGLLGAYLFEFFLEDDSFPKAGLIAMELYPGFSLYRGLSEFAQYASTGGMRWKDLNDRNNGMREVLIIILVEWLAVFLVAFYSNQASSSGLKTLLFLRWRRQKNLTSSSRNPILQRHDSEVAFQMEKDDVVMEREKVERLLLESSTSHAIICHDLKKIYSGRNGNPEKFAVRGLSLALPQGECFGMLGPNGAGKTSFINMMIGLTKPSSGTAYVNGLDLRTDMDMVYTSMGVCPQHDLLWETLTAREHLLFYGRLKNLKGVALTRAVEESLKSVNLFHGGVADKQTGKYSGGMKRRLSAAISLIGDPRVVYMDEPSTGLDPASRNMLWKVVKRAKQNRAIILTTHSMEEAEHLCDRLGIFVDGSLQCLGNPTELKARYGGSYVFTITTSSNHEEEVEMLVRRLSPNAKKIYQISGTQKFELPKQEIRIADIFEAVEFAKSRFTVQAWGFADTTLEDVFIKVARGAQAFNVLS